MHLNGISINQSVQTRTDGDTDGRTDTSARVLHHIKRQNQVANLCVGLYFVLFVHLAAVRGSRRQDNGNRSPRPTAPLTICSRTLIWLTFENIENNCFYICF